MRKSVVLVALLLLSCQVEDANNQADGDDAAAGKAAEPTEIEPGQWLITVVSSNLNYSGATPGRTVPTVNPGMDSYCLSAAEADRPDARFFAGGIENGDCAYDEFSMANGRISARIHCRGDDVWMRATLSGRYTRTRYDVTLEGEMGTTGVTAELDTQMMGERFGDC